MTSIVKQIPVEQLYSDPDGQEMITYTSKTNCLRVKEETNRIGVYAKTPKTSLLTTLTHKHF